MDSIIETPEYRKELDESGIFSNTCDTAVSQGLVAELVRKHFAKENGKVKKAVIMGYDGARADSLYNVVSTGRHSDTYDEKTLYSGFNKMLMMGGDIVLANAGGVKDGGKLQQDSSTAPGWVTVLTGKLAAEHGVYGNDDVINEETPTVLMEEALKGRKVCFNYIWDVHYDLTYSTEADKHIPQYKWNHCTRDMELHEEMLKAVDNGTDLIFGIYEEPDINGHRTGFGNSNYRYIKAVSNIDRFIYDLITHIEKRETYNNEDWLMLTVSDHGGTDRSHGGQSDYEKLVFIGSNRQIL